MKTVTETKSLYPGEFGDLEGLIVKLSEIRANTNTKVNVNIIGGENFGYQLQLSWQRPLTDEEAVRDAEYERLSKEAIKELRRQEYLKLKKEFASDG